jgi:galactonate dehydratase
MKITDCRVWLVEGIKYNWTLIRINTDTRLSGIGKATNWPGSPLVEAACRHVATLWSETHPASTISGRAFNET